MCFFLYDLVYVGGCVYLILSDLIYYFSYFCLIFTAPYFPVFYNIIPWNLWLPILYQIIAELD